MFGRIFLITVFVLHTNAFALGKDDDIPLLTPKVVGEDDEFVSPPVGENDGFMSLPVGGEETKSSEGNDDMVGILGGDEEGMMMPPPPMMGGEGEGEGEGNEETDEDGLFSRGEWEVNEDAGPTYFKPTKDDPKITLEVYIAWRGNRGNPLLSSSNTSCLLIKLIDASRAHASEIIHHEVYLKDLQNVPNPYTFQVVKPDYFPRDFHVNAVLNRDWCAQGDAQEWIRKGDYQNTFAFSIVETNDGVGKYKTELTLEEY